MDYKNTDWLSKSEPGAAEGQSRGNDLGDDNTAPLPTPHLSTALSHLFPFTAHPPHTPPSLTSQHHLALFPFPEV